MPNDNMNPLIQTNSSMIGSDTKKLLIRSALTGTVLAVAGSVIYGNGNISVMGQSVPAAIPLFASGAVGSIIADQTHKAVAEALPGAVGAKLGDYTGMVVGGAVCAAASAGTLKLAFNLPSEALPQAAALGGASYIAADALEPRIFETAGQLIF